MRAVVIREFGEPSSANVEQAPALAPAPGEVLVHIKATAANFVDLLVFRGQYQFLPERPFIPGKGPAGVVAAVGSEVDEFTPGDRVLAMAEHGGYGEQVAVDRAQVYRLPDELSFVDAASMSLVYDTAWFALHHRARVRAGDSVLVLGATGGVGLAALELARAAGCRVLAGVSNAEKRALVEPASPDALVDLSGADLRDRLRERVYAANGGEGVDVIIDPLGGDFFDAALRALTWEGRLVVVGFAAGRIPSVRANYLLLKNIEVSGLQVSDYRQRRPDDVRRGFEAVFDLYREGKIRPAPAEVFELERFAQALARVEARQVHGRAILRP